MSKRWKVKVEPSQCIGAGSCIAMARQQFRFDAERHSHALQEEIEPDQATLNAAFSCPVDAIRITEIDGDRFTILAG